MACVSALSTMPLKGCHLNKLDEAAPAQRCGREAVQQPSHAQFPPLPAGPFTNVTKQPDRQLSLRVFGKTLFTTPRLDPQPTVGRIGNVHNRRHMPGPCGVWPPCLRLHAAWLGCHLPLVCDRHATPAQLAEHFPDRASNETASPAGNPETTPTRLLAAVRLSDLA